MQAAIDLAISSTLMEGKTKEECIKLSRTYRPDTSLDMETSMYSRDALCSQAAPPLQVFVQGDART